MLRHIVSLMMVGILLLAAGAGADSQENKRLLDLVAKFPTPAKKDGKLAEADKEATDAAIAELLKDTKGAVVGLVDMLLPKGGDTQARLALHAVVLRVGGEKDQTACQTAAQALASTLNAERPKEIQVFILRELQLIGNEKQVAAIGKCLLDKELAESAAQSLLGIKTGAAEQFRAALPKVEGKQKMLVAHGLGTLKDKESAEGLRKLLDDEDRDTRLVVAWALANLPDATSAEKLLKLADGAQGYDRQNVTGSCFLLAENLVACGDKVGARQIYTRLHESRNEPAESYVKQAAAKGLEATK